MGLEVFNVDAKITMNTSEYNNALDQASKNTSSFASKLGAGFKTIAKVGVAAVGAATTAITGFAASAVNAGKSFDSSMSQVAATMGFTVDELNDSTSNAAQTMQQLSEYAQYMGSTTAFSASQAADALNYMALAGYDAETSMSMLPNVLNLASAGGMELATASDMITDASSALGLSLDETAELVDKMAKASSKSNTSVSQLGDAILTVGGTAKSLAGGTTELSTALGILADNGIKGAEGGTALRNIILSLSAPTDKAAKEMKALGLNAYDANGNLRPLEDIFSDLNGTLSKMTQGKQTEVLNTLFNKVDLKSANALLATSADRWEELSSAIDNAEGAAEAMAAVQLDNLEGDITLFKSALEGAQIAVSDKLTPSLREFVQFGSNGLSKITEAFKKNGLKGAMKEFGKVLSDGLQMVVKKLPEFVKAGMELIGALGQGIIDNLDTIIDTAIIIIEELIEGLVSALPAIADAALQIILKLADGLTEMLPELIPTIVDIVYTIVKKLTDPDTLMKLVDAALAIMIALAEGIVNAMPIIIEKGPQIIENLIAAVVKAFPKIIEASIQMMVVLAAGIIDNLDKMISAGMEVVGAIVVGIVEWLANLVKVGADMGNSIREGFKDFIDAALQWGKDLMDNFIKGITEKIQALKEKVSSVAQTVKDYLGFSEPKYGPLSNFDTYAPDMMELFAQGIESNAKLLTDAINSTFDIQPIIQKDTAPNGKMALAGAGGFAGDIIIPVYIGDENVQEVVVRASQINDYVSGGR